MTTPTSPSSPSSPSSDASDVLDLVNESVFVQTLDGLILTWNQASVRLYGIAREDAIGKNVRALSGADDGAEFDKARAELMAHGTWEGLLARETADGTKRLIEARWTLRRDERGEPRDIVEAGTDVTARYAEREELRRSEHRYRNLFQAMAAAFWELDFSGVDRIMRRLRRDGVTDIRSHLRTRPEIVREMMRATRVIDVNDQTVALFGRGDKRELLVDVSPFWPEGSEQAYLAGVLAGAARKPSYSVETRLRTIEGHLFDALFTASFPADTVGKGSFLVGVIDISERKRAEMELRQSEARYRNLFRHVPVALAQLDLRPLFARIAELRSAGIDVARHVETDASFLAEVLNLVTAEEVNESAVQLFGARDGTELHGPIAYAWRERPDTIRRSLAARLRGASSYSEETRVNTIDGRTVDVLYNISFSPSLTDMGMNIVGFVDIRDRVRAQAMVEQVRAEFAHSARLSVLGELTASIAHEVNQPLAAIVTNGETGMRWLQRSEPNMDELRRITGRIVADARRAAEVIVRVRSMASATDGARDAVAIDAVVEEALSFLQHELQSHDVTVVLNLAPSLPRVRADRIQLQQVLVNLTVNAVQAMKDAGTRERRLRFTSSLEGTMVRLVVDDTGPGIAQENAGRLFDGFFTTKRGGMGLGLPICRSIIEAHGGRIDARGLAEGGARLSFTLPMDGATLT